MNMGKWRDRKICGTNNNNNNTGDQNISGKLLNEKTNTKDIGESKKTDIGEMQFPKTISSWKKEQERNQDDDQMRDITDN